MALRLGMTVHELERRMSYAELVEWFAYFQIEAGAPVRAPQGAGGNDLGKLKAGFALLAAKGKKRKRK